MVIRPLQQSPFPVLLGALVATLLISIIIYLPNFAQHWLGVLFFAFGVFTSVEVVVFAMAREINSPAFTGTAIAMTNMLVMLGGVLFQPLLGALLDFLAGNHSTGGFSVYSEKDFQHALVVIPVGLMLAILLMFFIKKK